MLDYFQRGSTFLVIEKANGDRERHKCPYEVALKVKISLEMEVDLNLFPNMSFLNRESCITLNAY